MALLSITMTTFINIIVKAPPGFAAPAGWQLSCACFAHAVRACKLQWMFANTCMFTHLTITQY